MATSFIFHLPYIFSYFLITPPLFIVSPHPFFSLADVIHCFTFSVIVSFAYLVHGFTWASNFQRWGKAAEGHGSSTQWRWWDEMKMYARNSTYKKPEFPAEWQEHAGTLFATTFRGRRGMRHFIFFGPKDLNFISIIYPKTFKEILPSTRKSRKQRCRALRLLTE